MYRINNIVLIIACSAVGLFAADVPSAHDQSFVTKASEGGAAEVKLGQLAADKASDQKVKDFGKRMVADHTKADTELDGIAQKENLKATSDLAAADQALMTKLSGLSGAAFDKEYMSAMVKDHEAAITDFGKESRSGKDTAVKAFASKTLPTLREHLRLAKEAAVAVGVSSL